MSHPFTSAIIVAAGKSSRMGEDKLAIIIGGKPLLYYTVAAFESAETIDEIVVVCSESNAEYINEILDDKAFLKPSHIVKGGKSRQESVINGFSSINNKCCYVSVHDGARPLITSEEIDKISYEAYLCGAVCCGTAVVNTTKLCDENGFVEKTLPRQRLYSIATPQTFSCELYRNAIEYCSNHSIECTDDSGMLEAAGLPVKIVGCSYRNIKVTTPEDVFFIKNYIESEA